jgi:hypothetical protein
MGRLYTLGAALDRQAAGVNYRITASESTFRYSLFQSSNKHLVPLALYIC